MPRRRTAKTRALLTVAGLKDFEPPAGVAIVWDTELPGFGLRIRGGADRARWVWIFAYYHKARQRNVRLTIGSLSKIDADRARREARKFAKAANTSDDPYTTKLTQRETAAAEKAKPTIAKLWQEWRAAEGKLKKAAKYDEAQWRLHIKKRLGSKRVADVTQTDFVKLRDEMNANPVVANRCLALCSRMFTKAVQWGWRAGCAPEHPVKGVKRNPETPVDFFFSDEEIGRLLAAADNDPSKAKGLAIRLLASTGARMSEATSARWDQIRWTDDGRALWVVESASTKTKRAVARVLDADLTARLKAWEPLSRGLQAGVKVEKIGAPRWIFPNETEPSAHVVRLDKAWARIKKAAGVKRGRIHDLRHTVATVLTEMTGGLEAAFQQLGHATMLTTRRYAHLTARARTQTSDLLAARLRGAEEKARARGPASVVALVREQPGETP